MSKYNCLKNFQPPKRTGNGTKVHWLYIFVMSDFFMVYFTCFFAIVVGKAAQSYVRGHQMAQQRFINARKLGNSLLILRTENIDHFPRSNLKEIYVRIKHKMLITSRWRLDFQTRFCYSHSIYILFSLARTIVDKGKLARYPEMSRF